MPMAAPASNVNNEAMNADSVTGRCRSRCGQRRAGNMAAAMPANRVKSPPTYAPKLPATRKHCNEGGN